MDGIDTSGSKIDSSGTKIDISGSIPDRNRLCSIDSHQHWPATSPWRNLWSNKLTLDARNSLYCYTPRKKRIYLSLSCLKMEKTLIRKRTLKDIIAQLWLLYYTSPRWCVPQGAYPIPPQCITLDNKSFGDFALKTLDRVLRRLHPLLTYCTLATLLSHLFGPTWPDTSKTNSPAFSHILPLHKKNRPCLKKRIPTQGCKNWSLEDYKK